MQLSRRYSVLDLRLDTHVILTCGLRPPPSRAGRGGGVNRRLYCSPAVGYRLFLLFVKPEGFFECTEKITIPPCTMVFLRQSDR